MLVIYNAHMLGICICVPLKFSMAMRIVFDKVHACRGQGSLKGTCIQHATFATTLNEGAWIDREVIAT